jgi:hypothetical protein
VHHRLFLTFHQDLFDLPGTVEARADRIVCDVTWKREVERINHVVVFAALMIANNKNIKNTA